MRSQRFRAQSKNKPRQAPPSSIPHTIPTTAAKPAHPSTPTHPHMIPDLKKAGIIGGAILLVLLLLSFLWR